MIKNVIFDLGNVLVYFNPEGFLKKLGFGKEKVDEINKYLFYDPIWKELDRGTLTYSEAVDIVSQKKPEYREDFKRILEDYIYESFKPLDYAINFMYACKESGYNIYILSNFNKEGFEYTFSKNKFFEAADGMIISYQVNSIKPERKIYECLIDKYKLNPDECVFFDDVAENIEMADKIGIHGIIADNPRNMMERFMKLTGKEYFDIRDEKGDITGKIKERKLVHKDGDIHGTSHVWITRKSDTISGYEILLQKRSADKDSHPGCYDTSSAGHIPAGCDFDESAIRELEEELGIKADIRELIPVRRDEITEEPAREANENKTGSNRKEDKQTTPCNTPDAADISHVKEQNISAHESRAQFYGKPFNNYEISKVYVYDKVIDESKLKLQPEEVESVCWMDANEVISRVKAKDKQFCMYPDEVEMVYEFIRARDN